MTKHQEIIQLVVAYTLTGAFVFTAVITCLSLVGWVQFADSKQQNKIFHILIVEVLVIGVGFFGNFLNFDPLNVEEKIETAAIEDYQWLSAFWKPDNMTVDEENRQKIIRCMEESGLETGPGRITLLIHAAALGKARSSVVDCLMK